MTILTMPCWFYEKHDLKRSPSIVDGLDADCESRYRREGARFIINVGTKMGLRYDTMATGVVYFHRFYMFHSFKTFPRYIAACCCLFLAGKVEETPKKCKDIIRVAKSFLTEQQFAQFGEDPKEEVMTFERILLQTIKFDLQVDHPYGHLLKYAKCIKGDQTKLESMVQMAWTFLNDSLCTTLCLQCEPEVIAIALMHLAGKLSKFEVCDWNGRLPKHKNWWEVYVEGISLDMLEDICHQVLDLYSTPVPDTPHDSPPATPPTKSTVRKTPQLEQTIPSTPESPVKTKEVPVGQPIPRLEPGELKRKVAKAPARKDSTERKSSRAASILKDKKRRASVTSPTRIKSEPETVASAVENCPPLGNHANIPVKTEATYQIPAVPFTTVPDNIKSNVTQGQLPTMEPQFLQNYNRPISFMPPDPGVTYFSDGKITVPPTYLQNTSYLHSQIPVAPPAPSQPQPPPPLPAPSHANSVPYADVYSAPPAPVQPSLPPQYPPAPVPQYTAPQPPPPPPPIMLPNVALPPPGPPTSLPQPPPPIPMSTHPPRPPVIPPPRAMPPRFPLRPEHPNFSHEMRMNRDCPPGVRHGSPGPILRPPRFYHESPPHPRGHFDPNMPPPLHMRHGDGGYDMEQPMDDMYDEYEDDYNCEPPGSGYPYEYGNNGPPRPPPPPFRYGMERGPRPPLIKNPPRMEAPTGIAPVRITGSPYRSHLHQ